MKNWDGLPLELQPETSRFHTLKPNEITELPGQVARNYFCITKTKK